MKDPVYKEYNGCELEIHENFFFIVYLDKNDLNFKFKRVDKKIEDVYDDNQLKISLKINFISILFLFCQEQSTDLPEYWYNTKHDSYIKVDNDSFVTKGPFGNNVIVNNFETHFLMHYQDLIPITEEEYGYKRLKKKLKWNSRFTLKRKI